MGMTLLEIGAYLSLLNTCYDSEQPLPLDIDKVCRLHGARTPEERAAVAYVLAEKFTQEPDGYRHARCDEQIAAYHANAEKNRQNGRKGGRPKKGKKTQWVSTETQSVSKTGETETQGFDFHNPNESQSVTSNQYLVKEHSPGAIAPSPQGDKTAKRGTRLPDDWKPKRTPLTEYRDKAPGVNIAIEVEKFCNYWHSKPGAGGRRIDWEKTFINWLLTAQERAPRSTNGAAPARNLTPSERIRANIAQHFASNESHQAISHDEGDIIDAEVIA
jgi:uncharacterized protein YdaU (DUF1376 family)